MCICWYIWLAVVITHGMQNITIFQPLLTNNTQGFLCPEIATRISSLTRNPGNLQIQALTLYSPVVIIFTTDFNIKKKTLHFANAVQLSVQYDDHKSDCCSGNNRFPENVIYCEVRTEFVHTCYIKSRFKYHGSGGQSPASRRRGPD